MFGPKFYRGGGQPSPAPGSKSSVAVVPVYPVEEERVAEQRKRFVVERSKWIRGGRNERTRLLREDGHMCCLGFVCAQAGVPSASILDKYEPASLHHRPDGYDLLDGFLLEYGDYGVGNTLLATQAIDINDSDRMDDTERERQLSELFAKHGYEMVFVP